MLRLVEWTAGNLISEHVEVVGHDQIHLPSWPDGTVDIIAHSTTPYGIRPERRMWTAFEYMYRDAGNFKAFGVVILRGTLTTGDMKLISSRLSSGEYFVAEQVGVPALYEQLYAWSGGPTRSDHCWHELIGFREISVPVDIGSAVRVSDFVSRFAQIQNWDESLSPHFSLADL